MSAINQKTELIVRAIMIHDGHILINAWNDGYAFFPGGKVKHGETLNDALVREIREELNYDVHSARLIYLIENFYGQSGKSVHELGFYYLVPCGKELFESVNKRISPDDDDLRFDIIPLKSLSGYDFRPRIIRDSLAQDFKRKFELAPYHLVSPVS